MLANLARLLQPSRLLHNNRHGIISELFKRRNKEQNTQPPPPQSEPELEGEENREKEDPAYSYFERRMEIDTSFDFSKMRSLESENIP